VPLDRDDLLHSVTSNIAQWKTSTPAPNQAFISAIAVSQPSSSIPRSIVKLMLNVITLIVSKMTSHCTGSVQMREESESGNKKI